MLEAIYSSKLYRAHKKKDKIRAAIEDPVNRELVQQLRQYLRDDAINKEVQDKVDKGKSSEDRKAKPAQFTSNTSNIPDDTDDTRDDTDDTRDDKSEPTEDADDSLESSRKVTRTAVVSSTELDTSNLVNELKGTLNSRQDTSGVDRILLRENEVWVYYNDKVNLNNVMGSVLEFLNASGYTYLDFNRLARTDNAMVFELSISDTSNSIKSLKEVEDVK